MSSKKLSRRNRVKFSSIQDNVLRNAICIQKNSKCKFAIEKLANSKIQSAPVVDKNNKVVGLFLMYEVLGKNLNVLNMFLGSSVDKFTKPVEEPKDLSHFGNVWDVVLPEHFSKGSQLFICKMNNEIKVINNKAIYNEFYKQLTPGITQNNQIFSQLENFRLTVAETLQLDDSVQKAFKLFGERGFHAFPVVDENNKIVKVLSTRDCHGVLKKVLEKGEDIKVKDALKEQQFDQESILGLETTVSELVHFFAKKPYTHAWIKRDNEYLAVTLTDIWRYIVSKERDLVR